MIQHRPEILMDTGSSVVAVTDTATLEEWSSVVISVLDNDIAGAFPLVHDSVAVSSPPSRGSVNWTVPGEFVYAPHANLHGADSFTYIVCDLSGQCAYGHVDVTVLPVDDPIAMTDTVTTTELVPVSIPVIKNDVPGRFSIVTDSVAVSRQSEHGTTDWTIPGEITFTPAPT